MELFRLIIFDLCFDYAEPCNDILNPMSEDELYHLVNNRYIQFQKAFPFISTNNLAYKELIYHSFNFLCYWNYWIGNIGSCIFNKKVCRVSKYVRRYFRVRTVLIKTSTQTLQKTNEMKFHSQKQRINSRILFKVYFQKYKSNF